MIKVEQVAEICHEANAAYCRSIGDDSQPSWEDAPSWQRGSAVDGVCAILDGVVVEPGDSHVNWSLHKQHDGWVYGEVKDPDKKEHPCMVPFRDLPVEQQAKDHLFFGIVSGLQDAVVVERGCTQEAA